MRPPGMARVPNDCPEQSWPTARDGASAKRLSGTIVADRQGWRECQTIVRNNRRRLTGNAASVTGMASDNFRHFRHPWRLDAAVPE
ncbi:MAG: hypothetical protein ACI8W7_004343 [Gammaproteobacteria bacterium]